MSALSLIILVLLAGAVFGGLGYLIARSQAGTERGAREADLKVAEEQARQSGKQVEELRAERDELKEQADRLQKLQAEQSAERRGQDQQMGRLDAELTNAGAVVEQHRQELTEYKNQLAELRAQQQALREQAAAVEAARKELDQSREDNNRLQAESFKALATEMLTRSEEKLVTAADGKFSATSVAVRERLEQLDQHLRQFDNQRAAADAQLKEQITRLAQENVESREQTRGLVEALRKPQVRGSWGEMHLKRTVELAGMQEHCDFDTQVATTGDDGRLRPDMVVHLTGGKHVVVDAKVSLSAFLSATEATDDTERERCWAEHAKQLRKHIDSLAGKEYFRHVAGSPEFVVMYLPGESLLQPALERDPELLEYAIGKRVLLAGPTNLIMMLRTVAFAWTQAALQDNMRQVYELGRELYERIGKLGGYLSTLGSSLDRSVGAYNKAVGSLESRVLVTARKFQTLKVVENVLEAPKPVEQAVRPLGSAELVASADAERTVRALPEPHGETEIA
jgi:DNA recombination protein RmuC